MNYHNLSLAHAYHSLQKETPLDMKVHLSEDRIMNSSIPVGGGVTYNWAAMPVGERHLTLLSELASEQQLIEKYEALVSGAVMNTTEKRLVLHHLARGRVLGPQMLIYADNEEKGAFYQGELDRIAEFAHDIRKGTIVGSTGKAFTTIVQIGIGGSDLGPRALYLALQGYAKGAGIDEIEAKFISNVDPDDAQQVLTDIDYETTLFILVSKSGTTEETLTNYEFVVSSMKQALGAQCNPTLHMVAVTSKTSPLATSEGFIKSFFIDDYIGGRYSSSSAVGALVLSIAFGKDVFKELLSGAHEVDILSRNKDIRQNAPLMDALIGIYLRNVMHCPYYAILPYSQALSRFPAHIQQLDMESNGKRVNRDGAPIDYATGPVIFGEPGTNGQHSFYQLLHQGTDLIPLQFIGFTQSQRGVDISKDGSTSQEKLLANLIAQIVAFACGKDDEQAHKAFVGNRYSSLLYATQLNPRSLGALLAHYENKVMFQGFLWNINSFDQEGVQLGKVLAKKVLSGAEGDALLQSYMKLLF